MDAFVLFVCIISVSSLVWMAFDLHRTKAALRVALMELGRLEDSRAWNNVKAALGEE